VLARCFLISGVISLFPRGQFGLVYFGLWLLTCLWGIDLFNCDFGSSGVFLSFRITFVHLSFLFLIAFFAVAFFIHWRGCDLFVPSFLVPLADRLSSPSFAHL
jgi:hypothetical protein